MENVGSHEIIGDLEKFKVIRQSDDSFVHGKSRLANLLDLKKN